MATIPARAASDRVSSPRLPPEFRTATEAARSPRGAKRTATTPLGPQDHDDATGDTTDPIQREARAAFDEGEAAFAVGNYERAAQAFATAYDLRPHPATLYNLALSLARSGQPLAAWHRFDELAIKAPTPQERLEAARERDALLALLATVRLRGETGQNVCIDELPRQLDPTGHLEQLVSPGVHQVTSAHGSQSIALDAATTTTVDVPPDHRVPVTRPWAILALVGASGGFAGGTAAAALARSGPSRTGGIVAAVGSGVAVAGAIVALVRGERARRTGGLRCPQ